MNWWQTEDERQFNDETYSVRSRTCGVVWGPNTNDDDQPRSYRAWVRVQQTSHEDVPGIGLWLWNGNTPAQALSVDEARHLGQALLDAAQIVDDERDAAIRRLIDNTP